MSAMYIPIGYLYVCNVILIAILESLGKIERFNYSPRSVGRALYLGTLYVAE